MNDQKTTDFETARAQLLGIAYRILGSLNDAEDAVQDTYLKWADADAAKIRNPTAWLTTVCTRRCIDVLRKRRRAQIDYVGNWLPEPIQIADTTTPESQVELASSLNTAFLMVLERLTPKERAAYLLREIFDVGYSDIAETLDVSEAACRKLVSRATSHIAERRVREPVPPATQQRMLSAFQSAIATGDLKMLKDMLSENVHLHADGGGKVPAALNTLIGVQKVSKFIEFGLSKFWNGWDWAPCNINGQLGLLTSFEGEPAGSVTFGFNSDQKITDIYIVRNPDKLSRLAPVQIR